ncbi:uncharacterized protein LOC129767240 [Toxorhynchites rutilus septentrionalis]|uniref:uncharacterized protein LOC129767240 n=1 Tax=Toxorhynchites rutilus septentrionalis TaxID=329112 RepID=UPI0024792FB2|nr:uncharacterized protein LOC129767240 [Toxorhynchites rutilus septentrionalis]
MSKEESKYGFKDKAKAVESLELLKSEDQKYQSLTVRGLLGRAKRVLTLTKAQDKIKNIKEAIEVFEEWIEQNSNSSSKNTKPKDTEEKVETVPGLGFKDKEAADKTLKILEGRDPDYQKLAIKGLLGSAKRVLPSTKNEDKIKAIKEAVSIFEDFIDTFDEEERSKQNMAYLPVDLIKSMPKKSSDALAIEFVECYDKVAKGNYKHLRTKFPEDDDSLSWDIVRNKKLLALKEKLKDSGEKLFDSEGKPTEIHLKMIFWAYSPNVDKLKAYSATLSKAAARKRSYSSSESDSEEDDEQEEKRKKSKK